MPRRWWCREDAGEDGLLITGEPSPPWRCDTDGHVNPGHEYQCAYCGHLREDADEVAASRLDRIVYRDPTLDRGMG